MPDTNLNEIALTQVITHLQVDPLHCVRVTQTTYGPDIVRSGELFVLNIWHTVWVCMASPYICRVRLVDNHEVCFSVTEDGMPDLSMKE